MRWTIRAKLTALVLAVLLPLMAAAAVKFWFELAQGREDAKVDMRETAQVVAQLLDEILSGEIQNLEALASVRALDRIKEEDLLTAAARIRVHHPFVQRFLAVRTDGRITAASDPRVPGSPASAPAEGILEAALRSRQPQVGAPQPGYMGGSPIVLLVVPVLDHHATPVGVVAAEIDLGALSTYLDRIPIIHGTSVAIVTDTGVLVARTGGASRELGRTMSAHPAAESLLQGGRGGEEGRREDGVDSLAGAAPLARAPWVALAAMPRDLAYGPAAVRLRRNLAGLGIVSLAALIAAWLISRRMTRSVRTLMDGARGLAAGAGERITVPTEDELAELADQLNHAMDERRLAEVAVEARQRRIRALADVNRSLSEQLDLGRLLQQITQVLARLTGARVVVLWEADEAARILTRRTWTADASVGPLDLPQTLTFDQGGTGWIARHRESLFVEDIAGDQRIMAADWALRNDLVAFAGVPVVAGDELLGVLTLNLERGMLPPADDRALLSSFASQAAVAIRNAELFAEADTRRRTAETLSDLGQAVARALDLDVVAQRIADSARALLGAANAGLCRVDPESGDLVALSVSGDVGPTEGRPVVFPAGTGVVALAVSGRQPVATPDLFSDPRVTLTSEVRARIERSPYRAVLCVPLVVKDIVIGALSVGDREGRVFDDEEIRIAQAFADQAALAIDNGRLYEETHQRLRHLDSLREVVEQILVPISLVERLNVIARKAAELFGADRATIALRDGESDQLVVQAGYGLTEAEVGRVLPAGTGVIGVAAGRREGVLVNDYQSWPRRDPGIVGAAGARPAQAVIGCPLLIREQVIGAIAVGSHTPGKPFAQADLDRLASLAAPAALAIEHSRLYAELEARLRELQETQAQLVQAGKLSAMGQLVSGVAHELNNPLSVILGYGQLLAERELPAELRRPIELIVAQGGRMAKIVQSLLLFSRQRKAERGAVDAREAIEQTLGLRATQLMLSGIRVSTAYGEDVPAAEGDAHQLQQVFLNLILNAEQAILGSRVGGQRVGDAIRVATAVRVERAQTWVVVKVADNGPGIPRDVLPRIFEPFFTTKRVGEGTGLGLSVSYGIIQQHGGSLSVESRPGNTVFTIEVPAATAGVRGTERAGTVTVGGGGGRHALVVDDEPGVIGLVTMLLRQAGWLVDVATGGRDALERLRAIHYDVVLSDVRMPDGGGEELYRAIASERKDLAGRFLFMTGDTANPDAWRFLEETRVPVIEKPFTAQALLNAVDRVAV